MDSDALYDGLEDPIRDTDLTFQFLDTISPCTIFSDVTQIAFLKVCPILPIILVCIAFAEIVWLEK